MYALTANTTGTGNVAVGVQALENNNGNYNTAVGLQALDTCTTGANNTSIGYYSSYSLTTVSYTHLTLPTIYSV